MSIPCKREKNSIFATFGGYLGFLAENKHSKYLQNGNRAISSEKCHLGFYRKMKNCEYLGKSISSTLMIGGRYTPRQWSCFFML